MNLQVSLTQTNKKGGVSFKATKLINVGKDGATSDVATEISSFCKDINTLCDKNKERGYNNAVNGIKKSLPMTIEISSLNEEDAVNLSMEYRNFGKFSREATKANLKGFLADNIEFQEKWG